MNTTAPTIHRCPVILTKYLGPTNTRGSRVKATSGGGKTVTLVWDDELNIDENHAAAAAALAAKLWSYTPDMYALHGGCHDGCDGFAWTVERTTRPA